MAAIKKSQVIDAQVAALRVTLADLVARGVSRAELHCVFQTALEQLLDTANGNEALIAYVYEQVDEAILSLSQH
ncbi:MAG TPA: hypothetical protein VEY50_01470 [Lysobacter sp.]|nr:hypothetical protein [Lysobacter sp.]